MYFRIKFVYNKAWSFSTTLWEMEDFMTSKERAKLKSQAMTMECIFQVGKAGLSTQSIDAIRDALDARELVKINVLKNCDDDIKVLAGVLADRTGSTVVQVIGRKVVLYKKSEKAH